MKALITLLSSYGVFILYILLSNPYEKPIINGVFLFMVVSLVNIIVFCYSMVMLITAKDKLIHFITILISLFLGLSVLLTVG